MSNHTSRTARLMAVASYLEGDFPGHVKAAKGNEFRISHEGIHHRVVLDPMFLKQCPDYRMSCARRNSPTICENPSYKHGALLSCGMGTRPVFARRHCSPWPKA